MGYPFPAPGATLGPTGGVGYTAVTVNGYQGYGYDGGFDCEALSPDDRVPGPGFEPLPVRCNPNPRRQTEPIDSPT